MFSKFTSPFGKGKPAAKSVQKTAVKTNTSAKEIAVRKLAAENTIAPVVGGKG